MDVQITTREAAWSDRQLLHDMDLKIFDDVWDQEGWVEWIGEDYMVYIAELGNLAIGFIACIILKDGVFIEKIGVKLASRKTGASRRLLLAAQLLAETREFPSILSVTIPETFLIPGRSEDISGWVRKVGFKAKTPFHPDYFLINGESVDGVPCLLER